MGFVVVFNDRRDFFQVPVALHEHGMLDTLVTNFYAPDLGPLEVGKLRKLRNYRAEGLPYRKVTCDRRAAQLRKEALSFAKSEAFSDMAPVKWQAVDDQISRRALQESVSRNSNLFLY